MDLLFGLAAGVMVAAATLGLFAEGVEMSEEDEFWGETWSWVPPSIGMAIAFVLVHALSGYVDRFRAQNADADVLAVAEHSMAEHQIHDGAFTPANRSSIQGGLGKRDPNDLESALLNTSLGERVAFKGELSAADDADSSDLTFSERMKTSSTFRRVFVFIFAMTVHNFPEGVAVGVAYGGGDFGAALALTVGICIQNLPEGMAVSLPLRKEGMSLWNSFMWGQLSGLVQPLGAVLGALATVAFEGLLPYAVGFAAGAMLYVVIEEVIPDVHLKKGAVKFMSYGFLVGFIVMVSLDTAFA
ncbi:MAG: hypothetical protein MHM6MM_003854 [Cercozoa sp. M6MM]